MLLHRRKHRSALAVRLNALASQFKHSPSAETSLRHPILLASIAIPRTDHHHDYHAFPQMNNVTFSMLHKQVDPQGGRSHVQLDAGPVTPLYMPYGTVSVSPNPLEMRSETR